LISLTRESTEHAKQTITGLAMETRTQYFTTPIYYVNAKPHLGHAYTTIATDVATRFKQMDGVDTYFLTGTDEHGDKIVQAAQKQDQTPGHYVDRISRLFQDCGPGWT
jgi:methionyl-tRNA synthetase